MHLRGDNNTSLKTAQNWKDVITRLIENLESDDTKSIPGELFLDDQQFVEDLIQALPELINVGVKVLKAFSESLQQMPKEKRAEILADALSGINGEEIGKTANSLAQLSIKLHEDGQGILAQKRLGVLSEALDAIDFGEARKALSYSIQSRLEYLEGEAELLLRRPVALMNIMDVVAPTIDSVLKLATTVFSGLSFPPETLAYAVSRILEDIDKEELGRAVNSMLSVVCDLHRGSLIVEESRPYFKTVFERFCEELALYVDGGMVAEALVGLGDDLEIVITTMSDIALGTEELVTPLISALLSLANSFLTALSGVVCKASELPHGVVAKMAQGIEEDIEAQELGRMLNASAVLFNKLSDKNPELLSVVVDKVLSTLQISPLKEAGKTMLLQLKAAVLAHPELAEELGLKEAVKPQAVGAAINRGLSFCDRLLQENPGLVRDVLSDAVYAVDADYLTKVARATADQVAEAALENTVFIKAMLGAILHGSWKYLKGRLRGFRSSRREMRQERGGTGCRNC